MEINSAFLQLLMEVGLLAGGYGYPKLAEVIFGGLTAIRPENESPLIGLAFTKMSNDQLDEAIQILEEQVLRTNPHSDLGRSFLGLALKMAGRQDQGAPMLMDVVAQGKDAAAVSLARETLEEIRSSSRRGLEP